LRGEGGHHVKFHDPSRATAAAFEWVVYYGGFKGNGRTSRFRYQLVRASALSERTTTQHARMRDTDRPREAEEASVGAVGEYFPQKRPERAGKRDLSHRLDRASAAVRKTVDGSNWEGEEFRRLSWITRPGWGLRVAGTANEAAPDSEGRIAEIRGH